MRRWAKKRDRILTFSHMLLFLLFFCSIHGEIVHYVAENGTRPWTPYSPISLSYGYNNSFLLQSYKDSSSLDLALMTCEDQYDTGNETCCVVFVGNRLHS